MVQLQNQDPLNPEDPMTFTQQLCSLSQLEQETTTNSYLKQMVSDSNSQAVSYIGKSITVDGDSTSISDGTADDLTFNLASDASSASITVYDSSGNEVRTIDEADLSSGVNFISWDGTDDDGNALADGNYTFKITATDSSGSSVTATTYAKAGVTGVVYEDGTPYLIADGEKVSLDDITGVYQS